jgi:5-hydroxyisourate hydrolase/2-oxo-4-hydroxy-4-carboxy-5-ureidoimidazoline decarboxylase
MTLIEFNKLSKKKIKEYLMRCCGSTKWVAAMAGKHPYGSLRVLVNNATDIWYNECKTEDWAEALKCHPKIGDILILTKKMTMASRLSSKEQSEITKSSEEVLKLLKFANDEYEEQNGFIFILSATGKSSSEVLRQLVERLFNSREEEMDIAMGEQHKITLLRLKTIIDDEAWTDIPSSQITTHALDTATGKPAGGIQVRLKDLWKGSWQTIAQGETNANGRLEDLLPSGRKLEEGSYQLAFETGDYYKNNKLEGFYPQVEIQFTISDNLHYHIPLLLSPFGYSTYRGS